MNWKERPILITGCARSGTSIIGAIVHYHGAFGGKMTGPTRYNPKGQFENDVIRNKLVKPLLRKNGYDPLGQHPLPNITKMPVEANWKRRVLAVMDEQGYKGGPWFYKGAKMCLFWTQWADAFPEAHWIIVRREEDGIVHSCLKTGFMRAYRKPEGWRNWIREHKKRFNEMAIAGLNMIEVWPSKIVNGDYSEIKTVIEHVGLQWDENVVKDFIEPKLWHSKDGK